MAAEWQCPFCQRSQILSSQVVQRTFHALDVGETRLGTVGINLDAIRCSNVKCNELSLAVDLVPSQRKPNGYFRAVGEALVSWKLLPRSSSKPQPDYIPVPLVEDYQEACSILNDSPKAAATLARRCLQGMIRDFCGITKSRLIDEIKELRRRVDEGSAPRGVEIETVDAIDSVREIGNIGAHMGKDINLIIEVDPDEAKVLVELIEMLFQEWYVARHDRLVRLAKIAAIAADKKGANGDGAKPEAKPEPAAE